MKERFFSILGLSFVSMPLLWLFTLGHARLAWYLIAPMGVAVGLYGLWLIEWRFDRKECVGQKAKSQQNFDWSMHYFRGVAIFFIMACHFCAANDFSSINRACFSGATIFFLFISGYLCQYIDSRHPVQARTYYMKKIKNVISPFLLFSVFFVLLHVVDGTESLGWNSVERILLGRVQAQYWYIPFVSFLFLLSPWILSLSDGALIGLFFVSMVISFIFPRRYCPFAISWPETFYLYSYFTWHYLLGFVFFRKKDAMLRLVGRYVIEITILAFIAMVALYYNGLLGLQLVDSDLAISLQRVLMMLAIIWALQFLKAKRIRLLDDLAKYSFTLYFIHFSLFEKVASLLNRYYYPHMPCTFVVESVLFCVSVYSLVILCRLLKTALGKNSRIFIGS